MPFDLSDGAVRPMRVSAQFVDMPVVRRRGDPSVFPRRFAYDRMRLQRVQPDGVLRSVRLAQPVGEIENRAVLKGGFQFIGEHALPSDFSGIHR